MITIKILNTKVVKILVRYLSNEKDIYNDINDIKYLFNGIAFNENEDKEKIKKNKIKTTHKESPFKLIIEDIKRDLYYIEKTNNISTSEKLVKFKNELFNNNSEIKKDLNECKGIKYIRCLFNEDKNQKSDFYKTEKMKNKINKDLNEYKGIKDIRVL